MSPPILTCADCGVAMSGDVYLTRRGRPTPTRAYPHRYSHFTVNVCQPCSAKDGGCE